MLTGLANQGALGGQASLAATQCLLVERRRAQVPVDATRPDNAQCLESVRPLNLNRHSASLFASRKPHPIGPVRGKSTERQICTPLPARSMMFGGIVVTEAC